VEAPQEAPAGPSEQRFWGADLQRKAGALGFRKPHIEAPKIEVKKRMGIAEKNFLIACDLKNQPAIFAALFWRCIV
jgi:hypothetical protein